MKIIGMKTIQGGEWKPAEMGAGDEKRLLEKAAAFGSGAANMALAVIDESGRPSMKAINVKLREGLGRIWFVTHRSSAHGAYLLDRPACSLLAYSDATWEGLLFMGKAIPETDHAIKEKCWRDFYVDSFPGGVDDPQYLCLRFETEAAEYTDCSGPCVRFDPRS